MSKTHYIIPVFIPELACKNKCIYCNQEKITGIHNIMNPKEVDIFIKTRLDYIPNTAESIEVAFFGGNFTGIDVDLQIKYLEVVQKYINNNQVKSIRISTRPDYINEEILKILKKFNVKNIELGAQSMFNDILEKSNRGHTVNDTINSSRLIKSYNFELGLQMMIGMPGDTIEKSIETSKEIINLGAKETRIYPLLVFKDTPLYNLYCEEKYKPLTLDETIKMLIPIVSLFEESNVRILRIGLHPSEDMKKGELIAGPWHPGVRQIVYTELWNDILKNIENKNINLYVSSEQYPNAIGYKRKNKFQFQTVNFKIDSSLIGMKYYVDNSR